MINRIIQLSNVFIKDYLSKLNIFNQEKKKINLKSSFVWMLIILIITLGYSSYQIVDFLNKVGQEVLFLKVYFPIVATIIIFQAIFVCGNVFYFSKDFEYILPLPIRPNELLIAKFINVMGIIYSTGIIFLGVPLLIYGMVTNSPFLYYIFFIIITFIFPILPTLLISLIMLLAVQLSKFFKNKNLFQILLVLILTTLLFSFEIKICENLFSEGIIEIKYNEENQIEEAKILTDNLNTKLDILNNFFLENNSCIKILTNVKMSTLIFEGIKILLLNTIFFILFILIGKKIYLKNILKNITYINESKNKEIEKIKYKTNSSSIIYNKIELKKIIKNPTFFLQCILQFLFIIIIFLTIFNSFIPTIMESISSKDIEEIGVDNYKLQIICLILGILQIVFTFNNLSLTTISREGKNAIFMKYIPIPLYKQIKYKNYLHILMNTILIIGVVILFILKDSKIDIVYKIIIFVLAMLLNIINSYLLIIKNLKNPNLDWVTETSALKDNKNRMFQYIITIISILLLIYFTRIFEDTNIIISLVSITAFYLIIIILIKLYIKKNINKLFSKIN